ncbi:ribonuclease H-like domain-containing protein, partial [Tanacetum coccineum]
DLKWYVAMISIRLKKFYKKTERKLQFDAKEPVGFDITKVECFNCHNTGHFAREYRSKGNQESRRRDARNTGYKAKDNGRRPGKQEEPKDLVTIDGDGVDWTGHVEDEQENFVLMAYSNSGSNTEVTSCSKECEESYAKLKKLYDEQREQLGDASIEIQAYTQGLKKVEAQLVCHQQNQLVYEEKIRFMKIDLDDKTNVLTYHKKLLAEAVKEKEELKTKLENFQSSSKGLSKLLNSQMSAKDKSGIGYGDQIHEGVLSYENEVLESVFVSRSSNVEDSPVYDRFVKVEGMHAVPPLMTGIYMPPKSDFRIDELNFTYGPKQSKTSKSAANTSDSISCESNSSYESDSDDEYVIKPSKEQEKYSFTFVNTVKHVKTPKETVKEQNTCSPSPKADKRDWNGLMSKKLGSGYGFTKKACFICDSFSHLIRDCDFHEKIIAKQVELNKQKGKGTGQGENKPVWNNVQRLNHQNKFVPKAVLTKTGIFPVNAARQNLSSQAATTSTARKVNTARPIVNEIRPRNNFYKSHSPIRRPSNRTIAPKANFTNHKVNTAGDKTDDRQKTLKNKGIVDSGCSRHMTRNKAYLVKYQDYNGGLVAFGGSKGQIIGKGKIITRKLDFKDVYFVKELKKFNLFSVPQMCDKKNKVLFTNSECIVLSPDFKLSDKNQVLLRVPKQNNMYSFNLENIVPTRGLAYLISKATVDESNKWHRRLGHVNFKNLNKLVKGNLVRGLPSKIFQNDHTCVACQKGKQHKASCKAKIVSSISQPLQLLHMDLFGPTSVRSINHKTYCLVITDDFSRSKGIKREYSNARTPQQNGVAERKNRTLIEAARTMLTDSFLPNTFWAEAVSTTCYVLNRPVRSENQANKTVGLEEANHSAGTQDNINAGNSKMEADPAQDYFVLPICSSYTSTIKSSKAKNEGDKPNKDTGSKTNEEPVDQEDQAFLEELERLKRQEKQANDAAEALRKDTPISTASPSNIFSAGGPALNNNDKDDSQIPALEDIYDNPSDGIFTNASYDDEGVVADFTNLESTVNKISEALEDESWVDAMQEELLQFKIQKVWILVDFPYGKKVIGTKWVYKNKKDERGVVVRNKARIFLAFASYMGFIVYKIDVKSDFLYGTTDEEVYVSQPPGFVDPKFLKKVKQKEDGIFISQYKYVAKILKKFDFASVKTVDTLIEAHKPLVKDEEAADVDVHLYRFQVTPKTSHLHAVKRIFRYLKGKPKLGLWYPRESSFDLVAYSDIDYGGANLDRKSTTGGCQFLGHRLISWQCKKQTIMATSTTEAEYVAAANCCGQVLWIQNQMLDYGFNFMNTRIYIDNESTICIVKNPVFHSKTKHIEIRHHFIRDAYE